MKKLFTLIALLFSTLTVMAADPVVSAKTITIKTTPHSHGTSTSTS